MTTEKKTGRKTAAPKKRAASAKTPKPTPRAEAVEEILRNVEKKLKAGSLRASLGDYIKLIQLSKEMKDEAKTEIKVTWIEEPEIPLEK